MKSEVTANWVVGRSGSLGLWILEAFNTLEHDADLSSFCATGDPHSCPPTRIPPRRGRASAGKCAAAGDDTEFRLVGQGG